MGRPNPDVNPARAAPAPRRSPDSPMRFVDKARWPSLSPLLDELLDLDGAARVQRLEALRSEVAALAGPVAT